MKKVEKTTRAFRYDINQIPYDYTVEVREVGGGFMFGNACTPVVDSCQCMAKPIQYCKVQ